MDSCSAKGEDYFWCWTNAHRWGADWWNYCGVHGTTHHGHTVKVGRLVLIPDWSQGVPCVQPCGQHGAQYWWCRSDHQDDGQWDYCSPPGQVKHENTQKMTSTPLFQVQLVEYTRHGHACLGECGQHGENYWWCAKSQRSGGDRRAYIVKFYFPSSQVQGLLWTICFSRYCTNPEALNDPKTVEKS